LARYKLTIEYDGRSYSGWQRQANAPSVQQALEEAFFRFCGEQLVVHAAGRTDAGVHARGQIGHVTLERPRSPNEIREAVNAHLIHEGVAVLLVEEVADDFDARFSAIKRHYLYRIMNRRAPVTLERGLVWHVKRKLNVQAMHEAAQCLIGKHDFTTFRDTQCQANSPIRTLDRIAITSIGDEIHIEVSALSFLHRQVRSMVGSLEHVGSGKWEASDLRAALEARDRARCGMVAPPDGLYLMRVDYPAGK
jgi:tRNA pseudouridine38-40 synthase